MKAVLAVLFLLSSMNAFSVGCETYSKHAIACYENGFLGTEYDETGDECGNKDNFWEIIPSSDQTIHSHVLVDVIEHYMGGRAWHSECLTTFQNAQGQFCSFLLAASLGTEDADVSIIDFKCR